MPYLIVRESYLNNRQLYSPNYHLLLPPGQSRNLGLFQLSGGRAATERGEVGHGEVLVSLRPEGREK